MAGIEPLATAGHWDTVIARIDAADAILGVMNLERVEERNGNILGGKPRGFRTSLTEPFMPPAIL